MNIANLIFSHGCILIAALFLAGLAFSASALFFRASRLLAATLVLLLGFLIAGIASGGQEPGWQACPWSAVLLSGLFFIGGFLGVRALACYHKAAPPGKIMKLKIVGITGTIASGKSLVGKLLEEAGIRVLDTDHIAHDLQASNEEVRQALRKRFGNGIFKTDGALDRKALGQIVFNDGAALADLNQILHPAVRAECRRRIDLLAESGEKVVAVLVPLLFEAGLESHYDEIWTVLASDQVVRQRLKARDGLSDEEVEKRIKAQWPQERKIAGSDHVIDNSGSIEETRVQVLALLKG